MGNSQGGEECTGVKDFLLLPECGRRGPPPSSHFLCKGSTIIDWLPINSRRENLIRLAQGRCPPLVQSTMIKKASVTEHKYDCGITRLLSLSTCRQCSSWGQRLLLVVQHCRQHLRRCPGHSKRSETICQKDECTKDLTNEENRGIENCEVIQSSPPSIHCSCVSFIVRAPTSAGLHQLPSIGQWAFVV